MDDKTVVLVLLVLSVAFAYMILFFGMHYVPYLTPDATNISINSTYKVSIFYIGHPYVADDFCLNYLYYLKNGTWTVANSTQYQRVINLYGGPNVTGRC